jgi:hypothetical protein
VVEEPGYRSGDQGEDGDDDGERQEAGSAIAGRRDARQQDGPGKGQHTGKE